MSTQAPRTTDLGRLTRAARYSLMGLRAAWSSEAAFRQEVAASVVLLPLAMLLGATWTQRALLVFSWLTVLVVELLNSAVEAVVDRIGSERHPLSGKAKNLASAAVMLSLVGAGLVWAMVLVSRWWPR